MVKETWKSGYQTEVKDGICISGAEIDIFEMKYSIYREPSIDYEQ